MTSLAELEARGVRDGWLLPGTFTASDATRNRRLMPARSGPARSRLAVDGPVPAAGVGVCQDTQASGARLAGTGPGRPNR